MNKDLFVRGYRILKHSAQFLLTFDIRHRYEIDHYRYTKRFSNVSRLCELKV